MRFHSVRKSLPSVLAPLIFLWVLFPSVVAATPLPGTLLSSTILGSYTRRQIAALLPGEPASESPKCHVKVAELIYETVGVVGEPTTASAVLLIPGGPHCPGPYPLLGWGMPTVALRTVEQAKDISRAKGNNPLVTRFASQGYVVVSSDYLGLGESKYPFHPYLHAHSEATSQIDALRAARTLLQRLNTPLSNKVMLSGVSQGGHTALATQREIEEHLSNEFQLVASAPIAGPYALSETFIDTLSGRNQAGRDDFAVLLGTYVIIGMHRTYNNIYDHPSQVFQDPWAGKVEAWFPGDKTNAELLKQLPGPDQIPSYLQLGFYSDLLTNPKNEFRLDLERNDLLNWAPRTPILMCGSDNDTVVPLKNAVLAIESFQKHGSYQASMIDLGTGNSKNNSSEAHLTSQVPCMIAVRHEFLDKNR
ncbi:MAG TPA: alpha/beta hydrolase family protein [Xylella sp.]